MNRVRIGSMAAAWVFAIWGMGWAQGEDEARPERTAEEWIRRLGDEDYAVREEATDALEAMGKEAAPALEKALDSEDPEVRFRARQILDRVQGGTESVVPDREEGIFPRELELKLRQFGVNPGAWGRFGGAPGGLGGANKTVLNVDGKKVTLTQDEEGVTLEVEEPVEGGEPTVRTIKAKDMAALIQDNPDLAKELGLNENGGIVLGQGAMRLVPGGAWNFPQANKQARKQMQRMMKRLQGLGLGEELDILSEDDLPLSGLTVAPVGEALREHLALEEGQGRIVRAVDEDGRGAEFGLSKHDIVLDVDGTAVTDEQDGDTLDAAIEKASALTVLRKGQKVELKPTTKSEEGGEGR